MVFSALRGWRALLSRVARRGRRRPGRRPRSFRPRLEPLEERWALSTVTTAADVVDPGDGVLSLREAIGGAASGETIDFAPGLAGQTITLTGGELVIDKDLTIAGPGADQLTISGNNAGRVFFVAAGTVAISGLTISGGQAIDNGGGILVGAGSTVEIRDSTIANNSAGFSGGGLRNDEGTVTVINSTISGNSAPFSGGISNNNGPLTLINTTVSGNSATGTGIPTAGGLANYTFTVGVDAPVILINSTFSGNTASEAGSADDLASVQQAGGGAPTISLANTILAGSAATPLPNAVTAGGTIVSLGHNLCSDGSGNLIAAGDRPNTDPLLAPLGDYGGPTLTHALLPGSPAIDAGANAGAPGSDQRGLARVVNGTVDIGAFESRGFTATAAGGDGQSAFAGTAFGGTLGVTVGSAFGEPVAGGVATFTAPAGGASATFPGGNTATIDAAGQAAVSVTANDTPGSYLVTAAATGTVPANFSLTNLAPIVVSPDVLPDGAVGNAYGQALTASGGAGGPFTFVVEEGSSLPDGLTLTSDGLLSGTPTAFGPFTFTVTATDVEGFSGSRDYALTINPAVVVSPDVLPDGAVGNVYSQTLTASGGAGGPFTFFVPAGALPDGLTLSSDGALSGTPTAFGPFTFTVTATDAGEFTGTQSYALTINPPIILGPNVLPPGLVESSYGQTLTAVGGTGAPFTFAGTAGTLPPNLDLSLSGVLSGTLPAAPGVLAFTVTATDGSGFTGSRDYTLTVVPPVVVSPDSPPEGTVGRVYNQALSASGGTGESFTFVVTAGALPPGLSLSSDGVLSGTLPSSPGVFTFTVTATDGAGFSDSQDYTLTLNPGPAFTFDVSTFPAPATAGEAATFLVTARDVFGNVATGYAGTVTFSSSDPLAVLPAPYTFQPGDLGSRLFAAALTTAGNQSLRVTDGVGTGTLDVTIKPVLAIQGPAAVQGGRPYTLSLFTTPLGDVVISGWTIVWGDGTLTTVVGNPPAVTHVYLDAPNSEEIFASASTSLFGDLGAANTVEVLVLVPELMAAAGAQVDPGETATVDLPGSFGLTATLVRSATGTRRVKLFIGLYGENPTPVALDGARFYEARVTTAEPGDVLVVTFRFPPGVGLGDLLYFDPATNSFRPLQGSKLVPNSLRVDPARGEITVVFDQTSFPALGALNGSVFTVATVQTTPTPVRITPPLAAADAPPGAFARTVTFTSTTQITSTLTASPARPAADGTSAAALSGSGEGEPEAQQDEVLILLRQLLGDQVDWLFPEANRGAGAPARPPVADTVTPEPSDAPGPGAADPAPTPPSEPLPGPQMRSELGPIGDDFANFAPADECAADAGDTFRPQPAAPPAPAAERDPGTDVAWALAAAFLGGAAWGTRPHQERGRRRAAVDRAFSSLVG